MAFKIDKIQTDGRTVSYWKAEIPKINRTNGNVNTTFLGWLTEEEYTDGKQYSISDEQNDFNYDVAMAEFGEQLSDEPDPAKKIARLSYLYLHKYNDKWKEAEEVQ